MRAEDILWGGNNKCGITLKNDINMQKVPLQISSMIIFLSSTG